LVSRLIPCPFPSDVPLRTTLHRGVPAGHPVFRLANSILAAPYICVMATLTLMTVFYLRKLRLRPGEEHRDEITVQLEPIELGGERSRGVPGGGAVRLTVRHGTDGAVVVRHILDRSAMG